MSPKVDAIYYAELEEGARYLASLPGATAERHAHLGMANRYRRLALDSGRAGTL
jgi:hypothetical protein